MLFSATFPMIVKSFKVGDNNLAVGCSVAYFKVG